MLIHTLFPGYEVITVTKAGHIDGRTIQCTTFGDRDIEHLDVLLQYVCK